MRRVVAGLIALVAAGAADAGAQSAVVRTVGFDEAVARAIAQNPTVARAATAIGRAESILSQARAVTRPTVSARVTSTVVDTPVAFDDAVIQPRHQLTLAAVVSVPILAPARWAATAQARDQVDVATESAAEVRRQIGVAAAEAYLIVLAAQRQVSVEERALETARAHLTYAERRLEAGAGSRLNMLRAAQEVSAGQARVEAVRLLLRNGQEALGVLLAEHGPVDVAGEPTLEIPPAVDESAWMAARTDIRTQGTIIRATERILRDSWKDVAPSATMSFDPQYLTPSGIFQPARSWRFTVSLIQPIFLGGLQGAVTRQREIALEAERLALTTLELQARSEVRLAQETIASRERALASVRESADQAGEVLRITTVAFEVGATTNIEVIDAQRSSRDAETGVAVAQDQVDRARLDLLVSLGRFPR